MQAYSSKWKNWVNLSRHLSEIKNDGLKAATKKIKNLILICIAIIPVIIIRGLKPLIWIRFSPLQSASFGHLALNPEVYLCKKEWNIDQPKKKCIDLFFHDLPKGEHSYVIANAQLAKMWDRSKLLVYGFAKFLDLLNRVFPGWEEHHIPNGSADKQGTVWKSKIHVSFTDDEEKFGQDQLKKMGVKGPIIPFMNRESKYLSQRFANVDISYHNYRDFSINELMNAVEELAKMGCYCLRMGATSEENITINHPHVIDYAKNFRTEFMDIYLLAKCQFFLSASCGAAAVAILFRKPVAYMNVVSMLCNVYEPCGPYDIMIFKKYWCKIEKRFLSAKEIVNRGMAYFNRTEQFIENNVELVQNTSEEIKDLAIEMHLRLKCEWEESEEIKLQNMFWTHVGLAEQRKNGVPSFRIGALFLQKNKWILGLE